MLFRNLKLDRFQEEAIASIDAHHTILVAAPTGAGKTLIAEYAVEKCIDEGRRLIYTAPIKVVSNQKYRDFSAQYGDAVGISTGDVSINAEAPVQIMTTEIFRNSLFEDPERLAGVDYVVLDEIHYLDDEARGTVWEESLIFAPQEIAFICLSATVPNLGELADWMRTVRRGEVDVVSENERPVPLELAVYAEELGVGRLEDLDLSVRKGKSDPRLPSERREIADAGTGADLIDHIVDQEHLPCLYFCFSRKQCEDRAFEDADRELLSDRERERVLGLYDQICLERGMSGERGEMVMRGLVARGVAFHHAGMLPTVKDIVEQVFSSGLLKLLFTTETFAVGVNMPACAVVLDSLEKYDGTRRRPLKAREYQQMAGRAGRRGLDRKGFAYVQLDPDEIDLELAKKIVTGGSERVDSRFNLCYSSVLNLYSRHGEEIYQVCEQSFGRFQAAERLERLQQQMEEARLQAAETRGCIQNEPRNLDEYERIARQVKERRGGLKRQIRQIRKEHKDDRRLRDQKLEQANLAAQRLGGRLKKAACYDCPELVKCIQTERRISAARRACANLADEIERIESYQPEQVKRRVNLLRSLGYIADGQLASKGRVGSWVYGYELQTTELLFGGFFDRMDEDQINILAAAIVFASREREWYKPAPKSLLEEVFYRADKCIDQLRSRERLFGIKGIQVRTLDASLTSAVYAWSKEKCRFEDLAKHTDISEGDLVRTFRMSIELLRQTQRAAVGHAALREKMGRAMERMKRGVVDAERQLRGRSD